MKKVAYFIMLVLFPLLMQCQKNDPDPIDQLPPITQEGKNTFGCLLNGKAWTPKGNNGTSNYRVSYDPTYAGGSFDLRTYRYPDKSDAQLYLNIFAFNLSSIGVYSFDNKKLYGTTYIDGKTNCRYASRDSLSTYTSGYLNITRLDLQKGIISGTFEFTLAEPGCDTIKVTEGRFDKKL